MLGTHQFDCIGVHPTQRRRVDGQLRFVGGIAGTGAGGQCVGVDIVGAGNDVQLLCIDIGIDLRRAGNQVELVDRAGIQPLAFDGDVAAVDCKVIELTIGVQHRLAGTEGDTRGIDETAAVTGDAVGVGHDDSRRLPGHFGVAVELAGVGTCDFVEDGAGATPAQLAVAEDIAAQLGRLYGLGRVVENHTLAVDVVLLVLVVRKARRVGRCDVDHRHTVASLAHGGVGGAAYRNALRLRPDRLPEHDIGQQQGQQALGHTQETRALGQCSRRLTCQQG
ncbi:hypothetical protein D3C76_1042150 [compost metagenome]